MHLISRYFYSTLYLLLLVAAQFALKYGLFHPFGFAITLNGFGLFLISFATASFFIANRAIDSYFDYQVHEENGKTDTLLQNFFSEKSAFIIFISTSCLAIGIGFYLSHLVARPTFLALFIISSALIYLKASYFRSTVAVATLVEGILVLLALLAVGLFDLLPATNAINQESQNTAFQIVFDYALFGSLLSVCIIVFRSIQRTNYDHAVGRETLSVALGKKRTLRIVGSLVILPVLLCTRYLFTYVYDYQNALLYILGFMIGPLLLFSLLCWLSDADDKQKYPIWLLIGVCISGIGSLLLYAKLLL